MKKFYYFYITFIPCIAMFMPNILLFILAISSIFMIIFNFKLVKKIVKYNYNYIFLIFALYTFIPAFIHKNIIGICVSFSFLLLSFYTMYIRYAMNEKVFNIIKYIIGFGSIFSLLYTKINHDQSLFGLIINYSKGLLGLDYLKTSIDSIRISSTFFHPNYYGYVCSIVIMLSLFVVIDCFKNIKNKKNIFDIPFFIIVFIINIYALFLTQSRGSLMSTVAGIGSIIIMTIDYSLFIIIPILLLGIKNFNVIMSKVPRISSVFESINNRVDIWEMGMDIVMKSTFLGQGFYAMMLNRKEIHSHNLFIDVLACFGLIGAFILIAYLVNTLIDKAKMWLKGNNKYFALTMGIVVLTIVHGLTDMILIHPQTFVIFGIMYACMEIDFHKEC